MTTTEKERQRERETVKEAGIQTLRQTDSQIDRETEFLYVKNGESIALSCDI